jgi:hypothetical protein
MTSDEIGYSNKRALIESLARARFLSKRVAGISSTRKDGSQCSEETDIQATGAEYYAAQCLKRPFNAGIGSKGDGGCDITFPLEIEVVWFGMKDGKPREEGHLLIDPQEPQRWADIYVCVVGSIETGFRIIGWTTHKRLTTLNKPKDFGYGLRFYMHCKDLNTSDLRNLKKNI